MTKTLKKEQAELLRFERELLALGAGLAALTGGAAANAREVVGDSAAEHAVSLQEAYLNLVEKVQAAHDAMEQGAVVVGARILEARGDPKVSVLEAAKSVLGM